MRWINRKPEKDEKRIIKTFLFFPKTINKETRWLEFASIKQVYSMYRTREDGKLVSFGMWKNSEWCNK